MNKSEVLPIVDTPLSIGDVVFAKISRRLRKNGIEAAFTYGGQKTLIYLHKNMDHDFKKDSNQELNRIKTDFDLYNKQPTIKVKITGPMENGSLPGVCYIDQYSASFYKLKPADVIDEVLSDRIFLAQVHSTFTYKRIRGDFEFREKGYKLIGYDSDFTALPGRLIPVRPINRPNWESELERLIKAESPVAENIFEGSDENGKYGHFPKLKADDTLLVRLISNNSHKSPENVLYFFEPVVTIRYCDQIYDRDGPIVTGIFDQKGRQKTHNFKRGDIVKNVPIVATKNTEQYGKVGVGYIPTNDTRPLKSIWIKGATEKIVKQTSLYTNREVLVAGITS